MGSLRTIALVLLALFSTRAVAIVPLGVTTTANLGFGRAVVAGAGGSVTVSPAGERSAGGGVLLGGGFGASAATFTVTGEPDATYGLVLPESCTLENGGHVMTVDGFTSSLAGSGNLGPSGTQLIRVGATLHIASPQMPGVYSGSYLVTVAYD